MASARHICTALGGVWRGRRGMCRCPAHDDKTPSMSIMETRDGRPLVHCHANCTQTALIQALRDRGLWDGAAAVDPAYPGHLTTRHDGHTNRDDRERQAYARELWERSNPIKGTLAAEYLSNRGIRPPAWPDMLGFLPNLEHKPSGGRKYPAMLAAITDARGQVTAVQRTWLDPRGGKAAVEPNKMTVGPMGAGAVRLGPVAPIIGLAEGVETAMSAHQLYQITCWATLSATRLDKIALPPEVESLVIFADHGKVGMAAASAAAEVYERQGLSVDVMPPRVHFGEKPSDFNDVVRGDAR